MFRNEGQQRLSGIVQAGTLQQDIAARCGVKPPTVSRWLSGQRTPRDFRTRKAIDAQHGIPPEAWDSAPAPVLAIDAPTARPGA